MTRRSSGWGGGYAPPSFKDRKEQYDEDGNYIFIYPGPGKGDPRVGDYAHNQEMQAQYHLPLCKCSSGQPGYFFYRIEGGYECGGGVHYLNEDMREISKSRYEKGPLMGLFGGGHGKAPF